MSRIGNKPVQIPAGVEVAVNGNNVVVKGPKGQLELDVFEKLAINVEDNVLTVSRPDDERETRARHGLTRASSTTWLLAFPRASRRSSSSPASVTACSRRARTSSSSWASRTP